MSLSYILLNDPLETFESGFTKTNIAISNIIVDGNISGNTLNLNTFDPLNNILITGLTTEDRFITSGNISGDVITLNTVNSLNNITITGLTAEDKFISIVKNNTRTINLDYHNSLGYFLIKFTNKYNNDIIYGLFQNIGTENDPIIQIIETGNNSPNPLLGQVSFSILADWKTEIYKQSSSSNLDITNAIFITKITSIVQDDIRNLTASDIPSGITATKISNGVVSNTEFDFLSGTTSNIQTQINSKQNSLGYTPENEANKSSSYTSSSTITYPNTKALVDGLATKVTANSAITGDTKTKITYDSKGLVTAGTDLTASDIPSGITATKISNGVVSNTEFDFLSGTTSNIQIQIDGKEPIITSGENYQFLRGDKTWQTAVTSVQLSGGTGININGVNPIITSGTINITNTAPDQVVTLNNGIGINVSGTYPNFTITNTGGTVTSIQLSGGTGINITGVNPIVSSGTVNIVNTAPDQIVSISSSTGINVTGTYPNFTIQNTGVINVPNLQEITDVGNTTTSAITMNYLVLNNGSIGSNLKNTNVTNNGVVLEYPDKASGSYTIVTTTDIVALNIISPFLLMGA